MSFWERVSDATRFGRGGSGGPAGGGGGGGGGLMKKWGPWLAIAVVVALIAAVYSGAAFQWVTHFEVRLLELVAPLAVTLVLVAVCAALVGLALMKMPKGHFLSEHGRRLLWVSAMAVSGGAAVVPVALVVVTLAQEGTARLSAQSFGAHPSAAVCAAMGEAPTPTPVPHR